MKLFQLLAEAEYYQANLIVVFGSNLLVLFRLLVHIDLRNFWVQLKDQHLTTFNTKPGLYRSCALLLMRTESMEGFSFGVQSHRNYCGKVMKVLQGGFITMNLRPSFYQRQIKKIWKSFG